MATNHLEQAQQVIWQARTPGDQDRAQRLQQEALRQRNLLLQVNVAREESDFYPYRYLATEGFLPGYNFPALPLRAWCHVGKTGSLLLGRGRWPSASLHHRTSFTTKGPSGRFPSSPRLPAGSGSGKARSGSAWNAGLLLTHSTIAALCATCFSTAQTARSSPCWRCRTSDSGDGSESPATKKNAFAAVIRYR